MSAEFSRTLETAKDAESIARLLASAAAEVRGYADKERLKQLSGRYLDYAKALRETVASVDEPEDDAEQLGLLAP